MSIPNHMKLAISEIEAQLKKDAPILERLEEAMKLALNHWLVTNEDEQFRCAVGAVLLTASPEEQTLINEEMRLLRSLSSAVTGVPVDWGTLLEGSENKKWYGLLPLWRKVKEKRR